MLMVGKGVHRDGQEVITREHKFHILERRNRIQILEHAVGYENPLPLQQ